MFYEDTHGEQNSERDWDQEAKDAEVMAEADKEDEVCENARETNS